METLVSVSVMMTVLVLCGIVLPLLDFRLPKLPKRPVVELPRDPMWLRRAHGLVRASTPSRQRGHHGHGHRRHGRH